MNDVVIKKRGRPPGSKKKVKPGRKPGQLTKKAMTMLDILSQEHNFNPVHKFVELYDTEESIFNELAAKMVDPQKRSRLSLEDKRLYKHLNSEMKKSLDIILRYTFPSLKAVETDKGAGNPVQINISIPTAKTVNTSQPSKNVIDLKLGGSNKFQV